MISNLNGTAGVMVTGGTSTPWVDMSQPSAGMVRYNGTSQNMEVYNGMSWMSMGSHPTIQLTSTVQEILTWAEKKMREEQNLKQRLFRHAGLREAYERFQVLDILTLEEETANESR